jgi:polysaccharide biosynthesis transport protein
LSSGSLVPSANGNALPSEDLPPAAPIDLRAMIGGLLRRWKLIVAVPLLALLGVHLVLKAVPSVYQSSVQILVFDPHQPGAGVVGQQPSSPQDFDTVAINTEIEVLKSTSLMLRVAKDLKLYEDPEFEPHRRLATLLDRLGLSPNDWVLTHLHALFPALDLGFLDGSADHSPIDSPAAALDKRIAAAAYILGNHVRVDAVQLSYVLVVSTTASTALMAQRLATTIVNDYLAGQKEAQRKALDQLATWLEGKLAELKTRVAETDTQIERLKAESGLSETGKGSVNEQQLADLNTQLMLVRADVAEKRARLEQARQLSATGGNLQDIPEAVASSVIGQLRLQQSLLARQLEQLRARLGDRHAEVIAVANQLAGVNKAINDEAAHILADLQNDYDIAIRREQSLDDGLQRLTASQAKSSDFVKLQQLQRIADADGKLYDAYLAQYNEIVARQSFDGSSERIISPAGIPTAPAFPKRTLFYLGAAALGSALGVLLAFVMDYFQTGVRMGAEAEQMFGYPVVGNVPLVRRPGPLRFGRSAGNRSLVEAAVKEPLSPFSEAVRTIRLAVRFSNPDHNPKVILVTSSLPGEGKSAIATLLAVSSAAAGQRAVLVDCDVRGRSVSRDFGEPRPGLTDLLSGSADLASVTLRDANSGCHVISAGSKMRNPGDVLASRRMAEVMARLRQEYDYIVVDTPPLLSTIDALALASMADKILVTIDGSYSHTDSVAEALRILRPETRRIAGIVFNKVTPDQLRRYGYTDAYQDYAAFSAAST